PHELAALLVVVLACLSVFASAAWAVEPQDANPVTPGQIRANYFKRFPYAKAAAEAAGDVNSQSQEVGPGKQQHYEAYTRVRQNCIGGLINVLNGLENQLTNKNQNLQNKIKDALKKPLPPETRKCYQNQLNQLQQQQGQLNSMSHTDLHQAQQQITQMTQVTPQCPQAAAAFGQDLQSIGQTQGSGDQSGNPVDGMLEIANRLGGLSGWADMSTLTDNKWCNFKDKNDNINPEDVETHYFYVQNKKEVNYTPVSARESEVFQNLVPTKGLPMSDTMYQILDRNNKQRLLEQAFDPQRAMWSQ